MLQRYAELKKLKQNNETDEQLKIYVHPAHVVSFAAIGDEDTEVVTTSGKFFVQGTPAQVNAILIRAMHGA